MRFYELAFALAAAGPDARPFIDPVVKMTAQKIDAWAPPFGWFPGRPSEMSRVLEIVGVDSYHACGWQSYRVIHQMDTMQQHFRRQVHCLTRVVSFGSRPHTRGVSHNEFRPFRDGVCVSPAYPIGVYVNRHQV